MVSKKYKLKEDKTPAVEEPPIPYVFAKPQKNNMPPKLTSSLSMDEISELSNSYYDKLKTEADEKFGKKEYMTVDEYFEKLWYIVEGLYEHV